jgi:hypothetical protein
MLSFVMARPLNFVLTFEAALESRPVVQRGSLAAMRHGRLNIQTSLEAPGSFPR